MTRLPDTPILARFARVFVRDIVRPSYVPSNGGYCLSCYTSDEVLCFTIEGIPAAAFDLST